MSVKKEHKHRKKERGKNLLKPGANSNAGLEPIISIPRISFG
jgi:hypothetical protein